MGDPSDIEKTNLESHVELCALRYTGIEVRLTSIEKKVGTLADAIEKGNNSMIKVLVGTAGTIVTAVLSTLIVILSRSH